MLANKKACSWRAKSAPKYAVLKRNDGAPCIISYIECGAEDGVPVFFLHGWPGSRCSSLCFDQAARKLGIRIVAADRPGIGDSSRALGRDLGEMTDIYTRLADHLNLEKFALLGFSGACPYTFAICHRRPERVSAVTIVNGMPPIKYFPSTKGLHLFYRVLHWAYTKKLPREVIIAKLKIMIDAQQRAIKGGNFIRRFVFSRRTGEENIFQDTDIAEIFRLEAEQSVKQGVESIFDDGEIHAQDWGFDPRKIKMPIVFWLGESDKLISPNFLASLAKQMSKARVNSCPKLGHFGTLIAKKEEILSNLKAEIEKK